MNDSYILGISAFYHDSSASLLKNGIIVAACQEERFSRIKGDSNFPGQSIDYCLSEAGITIDRLDHVVFYDKPILKFDRILSSYIHTAPIGIRSWLKAIPLWLKDKLWTEDTIKKTLKYNKNVLFTEHHQAHAASAFYPSPFKEAAIITIDGAGEWATTTIGKGIDNTIEIIEEIGFPHSLGLLYSAFTYYCGFKVNSGEYKLMGLAPYGEPKYSDIILENLITLNEDGSYILHEKYFNYISGLTMISKKFENLFGMKPNKPDIKPTQFYMDIAASIQQVFTTAVLNIVRRAKTVTGLDNLVIAGGSALNCVTNSVILNSKIFSSLFIQPAAGDAGCSLGAALFVHYNYCGNTRIVDKKTDSQHGSYLGPAYTDYQIKSILDEHNIVYTFADEEKLIDFTVDALINQKVIGWFQGRMEFGPRALGNRSILGDPRSETMQKDMNVKIKFRESFRPFAPSVLEEKVSEWFETDSPSPYMLLTAQVKENKRIPFDHSIKGLGILDYRRSEIPAVTHVDYSARIQTVNNKTNPVYHTLINRFYEKTGVPMLINTSFNVRGEPIVCSPTDALRCFFGSNIDVLIIGSFIIARDKQIKKMDIKKWKKSLTRD
ncbi:MAG: hypothetical protein A2015_12540 [Spirochaetes bacterium GWF1_31_7]|nr:MAG: hypothetical protein A2Y30_12470 [Spirochaetes bacterium GWE1_32_154]OHD44817.1 MAG: hypothetical protein A2Y29_03405 [Spirochaetes bacterium GWE2_31_10]OHD49608.1 MAG: hypothetical protein A2015_12540 [Spirochaetes bacterium GWF1_31_7]OHD82757.1 MAG: hypothetical protein A2355_05285 [Spirochaetes bacterium RIFOXYB1_FULL_32_8]HBD93753.1 hypothetical protein [Spirochaetia bacterium]